MENNMLRAVILAAVLLFLSFAVSCGGKHPEPFPGPEEIESRQSDTESDTATPSATTPEKPDEVPSVPSVVDVVKNKKTRYRLVYSSASPADEQTLTICSKYIRTLTGCTVLWGNDTAAPSDAPEILYGKTNRPESTELYARAELGAREYAIAVINGNIVLAGSDPYALSLAFTDFCASALQGSDLRIPEDHYTKKQYSVGLVSYPVAVTEEKQDEIILYDLAKGELNGQAELARYSSASTVADCPAGMCFRTLENGRQVILSAGGHHADIVDRATKEILWQYTGDLIWNAHSIELLPNGVVAVAGSTGNNLVFFDPLDAENSSPVRVEMTDAHGVIWDPVQKLLWACGGNQILAFEVAFENGVISVTEHTDRTVTLPSNGAHDLHPAYEEESVYWVSTSKALYRFNSATGELLSTQNRKGVGQVRVKGVGSFSDGVIVQTVATDSYESWNTDTVILYRYNEILNYYIAIPYVSQTGAFYKVRIVCDSYH